MDMCQIEQMLVYAKSHDYINFKNQLKILIFFKTIFQLSGRIHPGLSGYNSRPTDDDKMHCVAFIVDASTVAYFDYTQRNQTLKLAIRNKYIGNPDQVSEHGSKKSTTAIKQKFL